MIKEQSISEEKCGRIYPKILIVKITKRRMRVTLIDCFFFLFICIYFLIFLQRL